MFNYRIHYNDGKLTLYYDIESACNSVGLFVLYHRWAIDYIEKNNTITAIELLNV